MIRVGRDELKLDGRSLLDGGAGDRRQHRRRVGGRGVTAIVKVRSLLAPAGSVTRTRNAGDVPAPAAVQLNRPSAVTAAPSGPETSA
jgi:hypothetical protein